MTSLTMPRPHSITANRLMRMSVSVEEGVPVVYANREALILLAKTCIKLSVCEYRDGFHVALNEDLDADKPERLRIVLNETE